MNLRLPSVTGPLYSKRTILRSAIVRSALAVSVLSLTCLITPARAAHDVAAEAPAATLSSTATTPQAGKKYELRLHHLHTGESLDVVYRIGDTYIPAAMDKLNHFLRDHRTEAVSHYDPKEFDVLHQIMDKLGKNDNVIDIVCGYRSPWSNNFLRTRGGRVAPSVTGVAKNSEHMQAKAIDIRVPGVTTAKLRATALSLHEGGVGYYPVSQFVHVDVGPVRQWTFRGRDND